MTTVLSDRKSQVPLAVVGKRSSRDDDVADDAERRPIKMRKLESGFGSPLLTTDHSTVSPKVAIETSKTLTDVKVKARSRRPGTPIPDAEVERRNQERELLLAEEVISRAQALVKEHEIALAKEIRREQAIIEKANALLKDFTPSSSSSSSAPTSVCVQTSNGI
jgi:hypothetical protein